MARNRYELPDLEAILKKAAERGTPHKDYDHTVKKAAFYTSAMTGVGHEDYIVTIKSGESDTQKERRMRFYHPRTKSGCACLLSSFNHLDNVDNETYLARYGSDKESKADELSKKLSCFDILRDHKEYMKQRVRELNFYDPNAFIVIEHEDGYGYAIEYSSDEIYDFEYSFGTLQYLITFKTVLVTNEEGGTEASHEYVLRAPGASIKTRYFRGRFEDYEVFADTNTSATPAVRVGFRSDPETKHRTAIGILEPATEELRGLMWTGSEVDKHNKVHGFFRAYTYAPDCDYRGIHNGQADCCESGILSLSQRPCPAGCVNGSILPTTTDEVVHIKTPKNAEEAFLPLSERVHFVEIPTHILEGIKKDAKDFEERIWHAVFNSDKISRAQVAETAHGRNIELQDRYAVYGELGRVISKAIMLTVQTVAEYNHLEEDLLNLHRFPKDYRRETILDLTQLRRALMESGAPVECLRDVDIRIKQLQNQDNVQEIKKYIAREAFKPFRHLNSSERVSFIATLEPENHPDRILYMYFPEIMDSIEDDLVNKGGLAPDKFYNLSRSKQKELVAAKVKEFIELKSQPQNIGA